MTISLSAWPRISLLFQLSFGAAEWCDWNKIWPQSTTTVLKESSAPILKHCQSDVFEKGLHNIYRKWGRELDQKRICIMKIEELAGILKFFEESNTILLLLITPGTSRTHNYVNVFSVALMRREGHRRVCSIRSIIASLWRKTRRIYRAAT